MRDGMEKIAVSRDGNGQLHACSAVCTHLGCHVHWNSTEQCWDCPCHGSHFSPEGEVLQGPAILPLERRSLPAAVKQSSDAGAS
jgi:Rieske Fe-S protein